MLKFDEVTKEFEDGNHTIEAVKPMVTHTIEVLNNGWCVTNTNIR